jgi:NDP-sugar pyrophosphorylase family protein
MNSTPKTASVGETREAVLARMRQLSIRHLPIVDKDGALIELETLDDILLPAKLQNEVVIMAGGLGTRLAPLTNDCPKPMLTVGGRPILETVLANLIEYGFQNFSISVNYKAEVITDHFGDGSKWGVRINYLRETKPLGTAGALSLLGKISDLPVILTNGDILTKVNFKHLMDFHLSQSSEATMCVREYQHQVPYGVVRVDDYHIMEILEKPTQTFFVNAGIYVLNPAILELLPAGERMDMPDLFKKALELSRPHAVFPIREYWIDVGQLADLATAKNEFETTFG